MAHTDVKIERETSIVVKKWTETYTQRGSTLAASVQCSVDCPDLIFLEILVKEIDARFLFFEAKLTPTVCLY